MCIKDFLKDYGTLVGSFMGFAFAVLLLWIKYLFDRRTSRRSTSNKLQKLKHLIRNNKPPIQLTSFDQIALTKEQQHVVEKFSNLHEFNESQLSGYNKKLKPVTKFIEKIEEDVLNDTENETIELFYKIESAFENLAKQVERTRTNFNELAKSSIEKTAVSGEFKEAENMLVKTNYFVMDSYYKLLMSEVDKL